MSDFRQDLKPRPDFNRINELIKFDNDYAISIQNGDASYADDGSYEIAVFHENRWFVPNQYKRLFEPVLGETKNDLNAVGEYRNAVAGWVPTEKVQEIVDYLKGL